MCTFSGMKLRNVILLHNHNNICFEMYTRDYATLSRGTMCVWCSCVCVYTCARMRLCIIVCANCTFYVTVTWGSNQRNSGTFSTIQTGTTVWSSLRQDHWKSICFTEKLNFVLYVWEIMICAPRVRLNNKW